MGGVGTGFGKLLLFGEHAAVHGHPALGISLPEKTTVWIDAPGERGAALRGIPEADREAVRGVLSRIADFLPEIAAQDLSIRIESDVERGVGFGSSAALCVAASRAALLHAGRRPSVDEEPAWKIAHAAERQFHGTPSGVDTGLSLRAGCLLFRPRPPSLPEIEPLFHPPLWLVAGAVPREAACGQLIGAVSRRIAEGEAAARSGIAALGRIAEKAGVVLRKSTDEPAAALGMLADEAMSHLRGLGLSAPALEMALDAGRAAGALGGKLSGAGAGGAFYLVTRDESAARAVAARILRDMGSDRFVAPPRALLMGEAPSRRGGT